RQALPSSSHAERPVQGSRRQEYWAADARGPRAEQAGKVEARLLLSRSEGGTVARAGGNSCAPGSAHAGSIGFSEDCLETPEARATRSPHGLDRRPGCSRQDKRCAREDQPPMKPSALRIERLLAKVEETPKPGPSKYTPWAKLGVAVAAASV